MARIFGWLCEKNHYKLAPGSRAKLMLGLTEVHRARDRHFGNGRSVRNLFEQAVRRMANRIAEMREISHEALMLLEAADVAFADLPAGFALEVDDNCRFNVTCPECSHVSKAPGSFLGKKVRCRKCEHDFTAEWGEPEAFHSS
jgi:hypothetical protein